jgi:regulator of CtrA degradation
MKISNAAEKRPGAVLFSFHERFAASKQFDKLYDEGMNLVEETAAYLDRAGRAESKRLAPPASLAYSSESIKLTTRLTQLASWLLVRRAIALGEITHAEAHFHRHKVALTMLSNTLPEGFNALPETFKRLIGESHRLYDRILRLDRMMNESRAVNLDSSSPVSPQMERIRHAFPAR